MKDDRSTRAFETDAARQYRRAADALEPATRGALRRARAAAVASRPDAPRRWLPVAAAVTGAAALFLAVWLVRAPAPTEPPPALIAEDLDLLLDDEELDLLAELEFYQWLEMQADVG